MRPIWMRIFNSEFHRDQARTAALSMLSGTAELQAGWFHRFIGLYSMLFPNITSVNLDELVRLSRMQREQLEISEDEETRRKKQLAAMTSQNSPRWSGGIPGHRSTK